MDLNGYVLMEHVARDRLDDLRRTCRDQPDESVGLASLIVGLAAAARALFPG